MTYALAQVPEYEGLMTTVSYLNGKKVNRFTHMHRSTDDLPSKVKIQRLLGQKTAACFQRCVGMNALNAAECTTFEMDQEVGTKVHERFIKFLKMVQEEDLTVEGAMTDVKGDRSLPPHRQLDPDMYVHVVEKNNQGIVVRGAKAHQTGALNSHWVLVMPTVSMGSDDADYAVSFVCPEDEKGITYIYCRQSCDTRNLRNL